MCAGLMNERKPLAMWLVGFQEGKVSTGLVDGPFWALYPGQSLIMWADPVLAVSSVRDINSAPLCVFPGHFSLVNQAVQVCSTSVIPAGGCHVFLDTQDALCEHKDTVMRTT